MGQNGVQPDAGEAGSSSLPQPGGHIAAPQLHRSSVAWLRKAQERVSMSLEES